MEKSGGMLSGFFRRAPKPAQSGAPGKGTGSSELTEKKARADETPLVPTRPSEEELRHCITHRLSVSPADTDRNQAAVSSELTEKKTRADEPPHVPPRPSEEESVVSVNKKQVKGGEEEGRQMENQGVGERTEDDGDEFVNKATAAAGKDSALPKKKTIKKKKNPFMPHVTSKSKTNQKKSGEDSVEVSEKKSLTEQLNELLLDRVHGENEEDADSLMEWWSTVKQWEPMSKDEAMTEIEEAQAFAVTAEKVQRGIRVFNQLFSERAETLWQHIIDLNLIADGLDRFNKRTKVAQITGGSTSCRGCGHYNGPCPGTCYYGNLPDRHSGGPGRAAAGGLTSASAGISNTVHGSLDRKKVERIVKDFQSKMADIDKCTRFIKRGIENLRELNAPKVKKLKAQESDFSGVNNIYEDGAMAGKALLINANEIARFSQVAMATGGTAARAVQVAAMATGILTGLFVAMDVYFVAKDSHELRKGAKSEFAIKIREVAEQLHQGLVELNMIREELQCSQSSTSFNTSTGSTPSPSSSISTSVSTDATTLTSSSSSSGTSNTSTSICSRASTSPSPTMSSSISQSTEAHIEP